MRKTNCLRISLIATVLVTMPLIAVEVRAAVGDIYESNMGMVLRISPLSVTPLTFATGLSNPKGLAFDGNGHLFVADAGRGTIVRFTVPDGTGFTFATGLSSPVGLTFDAVGNLFETDAGSGSVFAFSSTMGTRTTLATGLGQPAGLAFAGSGNLFVADFAGGTIYQITPGGTVTTFATGLSHPAGLAFNSAGYLFEADSDTGSIFKFAPDGTKTNFATGLSRPYGLAFEATGNLIVSDNGNGSTFRFTASGDRSTVFSSDFNTPQFVAIEPASHKLLNISTRGVVEAGDHVLIAGFVIDGIGSVGTTVIVRALGPSLSTAGIVDPLANPALEVRDSTGALIAFNDNWRDAPSGQIVTSPFAPSDDHESALQLVLRGGSYTVIVYSADGTSGTALVEAYNPAL